MSVSSLGQRSGAARGRHPAARPSRLDLAPLAERIATRLRVAGALHPAVGAAALATRGARGADRRQFAARLGVPGDVLAAIEAGDRPAETTPAPLAACDPFPSLLEHLQDHGY